MHSGGERLSGYWEASGAGRQEGEGGGAAGGSSQRLSSRAFMNIYCVLKEPETYSSSRLFLQVHLLILKLIHKKQIKHRALNYLNVNYLFYEFKKRNGIWPTSSDFSARHYTACSQNCDDEFAKGIAISL